MSLFASRDARLDKYNIYPSIYIFEKKNKQTGYNTQLLPSIIFTLPNLCHESRPPSSDDIQRLAKQQDASKDL